MKNKNELKLIANEIIQLEKKIQTKNSLDKDVKLYMSKINNIMESLSIIDLIKVINIIENTFN